MCPVSKQGALASELWQKHTHRNETPAQQLCSFHDPHYAVSRHTPMVFGR